MEDASIVDAYLLNLARELVHALLHKSFSNGRHIFDSTIQPHGRIDTMC